MTALLFFHVLVSFVLLGAVGATALALRAGAALAWKAAAFGVVPSAVVAVVLGESLASEQGARGGWLDASRGLALAGLVAGGIVLAALARWRPRAAGYAAAAVLLVALVTVFVMAAKP